MSADIQSGYKFTVSTHWLWTGEEALVVRTVSVDRVSQTSRVSVCSLRRERPCRTSLIWSLRGDSPTPELYLHIRMSVRKLHNKWRITCSSCRTSNYSQMQALSLFLEEICQYTGETFHLWSILYEACKLCELCTKFLWHMQPLVTTHTRDAHWT